MWARPGDGAAGAGQATSTMVSPRRTSVPLANASGTQRSSRTAATVCRRRSARRFIRKAPRTLLSIFDCSSCIRYTPNVSPNSAARSATAAKSAASASWTVTLSVTCSMGWLSRVVRSLTTMVNGTTPVVTGSAREAYWNGFQVGSTVSPGWRTFGRSPGGKTTRTVPGCTRTRRFSSRVWPVNGWSTGASVVMRGACPWGKSRRTRRPFRCRNLGHVYQSVHAFGRRRERVMQCRDRLAC